MRVSMYIGPNYPVSAVHLIYLTRAKVSSVLNFAKFPCQDVTLNM